MTPERRIIRDLAQIHTFEEDVRELVEQAKALESGRRSRARRVAVKRAPRRKAEAGEEAKAQARRAKVYALVDKRSDGVCEQANSVICCMNDAAEHDHFWGRGKAEETPESVWHLCKFHHDLKTLNDPSRLHWLQVFRDHCFRNDFREELAKCDRAIALERAKHPERHG